MCVRVYRTVRGSPAQRNERLNTRASRWAVCARTPAQPSSGCRGGVAPAGNNERSELLKGEENNRLWIAVGRNAGSARCRSINSFPLATEKKRAHAFVRSRSSRDAESALQRSFATTTHDWGVGDEHCRVERGEPSRLQPLQDRPRHFGGALQKRSRRLQSRHPGGLQPSERKRRPVGYQCGPRCARLLTVASVLAGQSDRAKPTRPRTNQCSGSMKDGPSDKPRRRWRGWQRPQRRRPGRRLRVSACPGLLHKQGAPPEGSAVSKDRGQREGCHSVQIEK